MWLWIAEIAGAVIVGVILGLFYFGGLWWTVRRVMHSRRPGLLIFASFLVRLLGTLVVLLLIVREHWILGAVCVAVMIVTRAVLTAKLGRVGDITSKQPGGTDNGS